MKPALTPEAMLADMGLHDLCARCYRDQQNRFRAESKQVRR